VRENTRQKRKETEESVKAASTTSTLPSSSPPSSSTRFTALTAASSLAQTIAGFELAMQIATPRQTRTTPLQPTEIVKEQARQFKEIIDDETAKLNTANRVCAHHLQCKKRKFDEYQREIKRMER